MLRDVGNHRDVRCGAGKDRRIDPRHVRLDQLQESVDSGFGSAIGRTLVFKRDHDTQNDLRAG